MEKNVRLDRDYLLVSKNKTEGTVRVWEDRVNGTSYAFPLIYAYNGGRAKRGQS